MRNLLAVAQSVAAAALISWSGTQRLSAVDIAMPQPLPYPFEPYKELLIPRSNLGIGTAPYFVEALTDRNLQMEMDKQILASKLSIELAKDPTDVLRLEMTLDRNKYSDKQYEIYDFFLRDLAGQARDEPPLKRPLLDKDTSATIDALYDFAKTWDPTGDIGTIDLVLQKWSTAVKLYDATMGVAPSERQARAAGLYREVVEAAYQRLPTVVDRAVNGPRFDLGLNRLIDQRLRHGGVNSQFPLLSWGASEIAALDPALGAQQRFYFEYEQAAKNPLAEVRDAQIAKLIDQNKTILRGLRDLSGRVSALEGKIDSLLPSDKDRELAELRQTEQELRSFGTLTATLIGKYDPKLGQYIGGLTSAGISIGIGLARMHVDGLGGVASIASGLSTLLSLGQPDVGAMRHRQVMEALLQIRQDLQAIHNSQMSALQAIASNMNQRFDEVDNSLWRLRWDTTRYANTILANLTDLKESSARVEQSQQRLIDLVKYYGEQELDAASRAKVHELGAKMNLAFGPLRVNPAQGLEESPKALAVYFYGFALGPAGSMDPVLSGSRLNLLDHLCGTNNIPVLSKFGKLPDILAFPGNSEFPKNSICFDYGKPRDDLSEGYHRAEQSAEAHAWSLIMAGRTGPLDNREVRRGFYDDVMALPRSRTTNAPSVFILPNPTLFVAAADSYAQVRFLNFDRLSVEDTSQTERLIEAASNLKRFVDRLCSSETLSAAVEYEGKRLDDLIYEVHLLKDQLESRARNVKAQERKGYPSDFEKEIMGAREAAKATTASMPVARQDMLGQPLDPKDTRRKDITIDLPPMDEAIIKALALNQLVLHTEVSYEGWHLTPEQQLYLSLSFEKLMGRKPNWVDMRILLKNAPKLQFIATTYLAPPKDDDRQHWTRLVTQEMNDGILNSKLPSEEARREFARYWRSGGAGTVPQKIDDENVFGSPERFVDLWRAQRNFDAGDRGIDASRGTPRESFFHKEAKTTWDPRGLALAKEVVEANENGSTNSLAEGKRIDAQVGKVLQGFVDLRVGEELVDSVMELGWRSQAQHWSPLERNGGIAGAAGASLENVFTNAIAQSAGLSAGAVHLAPLEAALAEKKTAFAEFQFETKLFSETARASEPIAGLDALVTRLTLLNAADKEALAAKSASKK